MKKLLINVLLIMGWCACYSQTYPFQNPDLADEKRLDNLISLMTMDEKITCLSSRLSIPRLGVKGTRIVEGLHGLALSGPANWAVKGKGESATTTFPQAYGLGETWDPDLINRVASLEAEECRYLLQNKDYGSAGLIVLAPNADLGRDIRWGRTEECYGEDAFLNSRLTVAFVKGLQGNDAKYWKTASLMKHFLANSNENNRTINSSDFDDRLFREYYAYGFFKGVTEGGSRAYMAAYNKYNGIPCTVSPVLKDVTVKQWGQNGIICTDGGAFSLLLTAHKYYPDLATAASACLKAGITMFLDNYRKSVEEALSKNMITEDEINTAIRCNLRVLLKLGLLDNSPKNPYSGIGVTDSVKPWTKPESHDLAYQATVKSIVLLKNEGNVLPVQKDQIKTIAVIGPSANMVISDWYGGKPPYTVSALKGIRKAAGDKIEVLFAQSNKADSAVIAAKKADIAVVCIGNDPLGHNAGWGKSYVAGEGREEVDRQAITIEQEDLVKLVMAANPKTVLVLISSFPYAINWSNEHVPAILHMTQSSQELGNGLADVLFGKQNPAGRLTQTWSASIDELLPILDYNLRDGRTYMYDKHTPLFPFGYGLSYTTFEYSAVQTDKKSLKDGQTLNVTFRLKNTGNFDGEEVVQLYASYPGSQVARPIKQLRAFSRVFVPKGQTIDVTLPLKAEDLKYWDVKSNSFVLEKGNVHFFIGGSSVDERISGVVTVE
jgi:beta-glucosidase